jgi:hypothetical protein
MKDSAVNVPLEFIPLPFPKKASLCGTLNILVGPVLLSQFYTEYLWRAVGWSVLLILKYEACLFSQLFNLIM